MIENQLESAELCRNRLCQDQLELQIHTFLQQTLKLNQHCIDNDVK